MDKSYLSLFKAYDVRGTYPLINGNIAYWTGYSLVKEVLQKENLPAEVCVVHDHRNSSPELYKCIVAGIKDAGGKPILLGLGSTDMLYASTQLFNCAGVMITASHNPPADNGIKIVKRPPDVLGVGTGLEKMRDSIYFQELKEIDINNITEPQEDTESKNKLYEFYNQKIKLIGDVDLIQEKLTERKLTVVVDTGNGIGGFIMKEIMQVYPQINFIPLFWELDGNYPNHTADPIQDKNIVDLQKTVMSSQADFGIAFDGDADRAFFIDENGNRVIGDYLVAEFGKYMLKNYFAGKDSLKDRNPVIVYNYPASRCTADLAAENGGKGEPAKQGHNFMKAKVSETKALYGGEHSGHHYFAEFGSMDSGVMTTAFFINVIIKNNLKASELTAELYSRYLLSGEMNFKLQDQMSTEDRLKDLDLRLKRNYTDCEYVYLDGITVLYPDWKANIRLSNTEPLLRLNVEIRRGLINQTTTNAPTRDDVDKKVEEIKSILGL